MVPFRSVARHAQIGDRNGEGAVRTGTMPIHRRLGSLNQLQEPSELKVGADAERRPLPVLLYAASDALDLHEPNVRVCRLGLRDGFENPGDHILLVGSEREVRSTTECVEAERGDSDDDV